MSKTLSRIDFLNNARDGKNNWWRYLITIILSLLVASVVAGVIVAIFLVLGILIFHLNINLADISLMLEQPLFILALIPISFALSFLLLYIGVKVLHHRDFISLINTGKKVRWIQMAKGAGAWLAIILVLDLISYLISPESFQISFNSQRFWILLIIALIGFPIQASFEEVFFRGYLMQGVGLLFKKPWVVLLVTSIIFSALHWWNGSNLVMSTSITLSTFIVGFMLGIIVLADNGIEMALGVHIINNIYVSVIHSSPDGGLGNLPSLVVSPSDPYASPLVLIVASLILIAILFRNRKEDVLRIFREK